MAVVMNRQRYLFVTNKSLSWNLLSWSSYLLGGIDRRRWSGWVGWYCNAIMLLHLTEERDKQNHAKCLTVSWSLVSLIYSITAGLMMSKYVLVLERKIINWSRLLFVSAWSYYGVTSGLGGAGRSKTIEKLHFRSPVGAVGLLYSREEGGGDRVETPLCPPRIFPGKHNPTT